MVAKAKTTGLNEAFLKRNTRELSGPKRSGRFGSSSTKNIDIGEMHMTKNAMTEAILAAKNKKKASWAAIARAAGLSEVYTTSACLGENALDTDTAKKVAKFLALSPAVAAALLDFANKGEASPTTPKEPLQYRFQEIIYVYGRTMKELIEEKFGAGIMSAIDFTMDIEKVPDPKGDRVKVTLNGKFLAYKKW